MFNKPMACIFTLLLLGVNCCCAQNEWEYRSKVRQDEERVKYEKKLRPKSGYMTVQEYELESIAKTNLDEKTIL